MRCYITIFLVLGIFAQGFGQKVKILLIGASHDYSKSQDQNFSNIHQRIRAFKPSAFFGEFVSPEDEATLMDYWCKADNLKRLKKLRSTRHIPLDKINRVIDSLKVISERDNDNFYLKSDLAHAYYLAQDAANGHYLYWQVYDHLNKSADSKLEKYVDSLLCPKQDVSGRSMKRLANSEYAFIAFPMMKEFGITRLLSMDCQDYDLNWTASAIAFHNKFKVFQKDSLATAYKAIAALLEKRDKGFKKYQEMERSSNVFTEWLNTDEAADILASGDFYFNELYNFKNFPKEEILSQIHWWKKRNEGMCMNIVNRANEIRAKRVVVIVGANHRKFMQEIFQKIPNIEVLTL
ncbi:DUF5694 domain-containing protein [Pedobacter mendelii]|uniref:DUF5694 domain-containing protein n=1 Tax=Pedobacter mendelii TaxID=1908240 RepID=UPI00360DC3C3